MRTEHKLNNIEYIFRSAIPRIVLALTDESLDIRKLTKTTMVSQGTVEDGLEKLTKGGFVEEDREAVYPFRRIFYLTNKGIELAQAFKQLEELVRSVPQ